MTLDYLRPLHPDVVFTRTKRPDVDAQVVVDSEPQQLETDLSRRVTVLLESWVTLPNKSADVHASFELMTDVLFDLQQAPKKIRRVVRFDSPIGPRVVRDDLKFEYHEGSITLVVSPV